MEISHITDVNESTTLGYYLHSLQQSGFMAYEYNSFHNYRITNQKLLSDGNIDPNAPEIGSIVDFDTEELKFDLEHPVDIQIQPSYDGSVNLILNDGKNQPRLINSRFSYKGMGEYSIEDRIGDNDTNIYDQGIQFNQDTSLYKKIQSIPKVKFNAVLPVGSLKVGNYVLYFKYMDADGNETDFVGESGIISIFKGNDKDPLSIDGGVADMIANKTIHMTISNIDDAYDYIKVYVSRTSAQQDGNKFTETYKLNKKFIVRHKICNVIITGEEEFEQVTENEINNQYTLVESAKTQAQCQNMLFLGNIQKPSIKYKKFIDLSLHIAPYYKKHESEKLIGKVDVNSYTDNSNTDTDYEYYNTKNIYYHVGYWNQEIYRLGIVYILQDGSLSQVFNILGNNALSTTPSFLNIGLDEELGIDEEYFTIKNADSKFNSKGVVRINDDDFSTKYVYSLNVAIPENVLKALQEEYIQGFFFVRQKRIPNLLAQAYLLPHDTYSNLPILHYNENFYIESFIDKDKQLTHNYQDRLFNIEYFNERTKSLTGICPEFEINQPYFNSVFTGSEYSVAKVYSDVLNKSPYDTRFYTLDPTDAKKVSKPTINKFKICAITDENPLVNIDNYGFRGVAGEAEEATKFRYIGKDQRGNDNAVNFVRGIFSPYLGLVGNGLSYDDLVNIYISNYSTSKMNTYFKTRYEDDSPYFAISERISINDMIYSYNHDDYGYNVEIFRGDCFICNFTHRLNRNFSDTAAPTNDTIVEPNCWKDNYKSNKTDDWNKINLGDVNAVQLGSWITIKFKSSINLSIRSQDESHINEKSIVGNARSFYPLQQGTVEGSYKIANSYIVNNGFKSLLSSKEYYIQPDVPYLKNSFENRIIYSDIAVNDAFKNGYRVFGFTNFRDYSKEYGAITKLIELQGNLLCVFEHGVTLIPINEKNLIQGSREVFINSNNVLPMTGQVLSNMYGSQWAESIIKTPYYVYGVDTVGKKIWRTNGQSFEVISDGKVNKYLIDNISLEERENIPIIGIRNVKTHYNANKSDVMFTFYDNTFGFEEKAWNLCWNELLQQFTTFYSWIPSYSDNINNQYYSFDRNSSKIITKLSGYDGIKLDSHILDFNLGELYINKINKRYIPKKCNIIYELIKDNSCLNKYFTLTGKTISIKQDSDNVSPKEKLKEYFKNNKIGYLKIKASITFDNIKNNLESYETSYKKYLTANYGYYEFVVGITSKQIYDNNKLTDKKSLSLTTDFWKHGTAGIYDITDPIKPTFWYGEQHPFEFEFVVNGNGADSQVQKIFNNLIILSNKAEPESFHFDIVGEGYEFSKDKLNMYYRQESTKELFQNMGSDIIFNRKYKELTPIKNVKSSIFPLYYYRKDTYNEVYDSYYRQNVNEKDTKQFFNMSGSEIYWDKDLNEFRIVTHIPNNPINKVGRLRGNSHYKEDRWDIQIPSITFKQKNEQPWVDKTPPIVLKTVPQDLTTWDITDSLMPNNETTKKLDLSSWAETKETKIRDKYIRIRVRYSGKDLAIITAIHTLYTLSYA